MLPPTRSSFFEGPSPKKEPTHVPSVRWSVLRRLDCPKVLEPPPSTFSSLLEQRRSVRTMQPMPFRQVVNAVAFATQSRFMSDVNGVERYRRPSPSAGALHPLELILVDWRGTLRIFRSVPDEGKLDLLGLRRPQAANDFRARCRELLPGANGTALVLLGHPDRTRSCYDHFESLLWRDSGALLQTLFLTFVAYGARFCPMGLLGHEVTFALGMESDLVAAGTALVGH